MEPMILTVYMLIWPVIVAGTLFVIARAFLREWRQARRHPRPMVCPVRGGPHARGPWGVREPTAAGTTSTPGVPRPFRG
ncbi:MAG: putative transporter small subunit [Micrococcaceae bacterium]|nr:putative transporter small subunit [Micrococcaceae bacterium]